MKKTGLFSLLLLLIFSACRKDIDDVQTSTNSPQTPILSNWVPEQSMVKSSLTGMVLDEEQRPLTGVRVEFNEWVTSTDEFGHFFFNDMDMNELGAVVKVEKDGYFDGSRRFFPIAGNNNKIRIEMLPQTFDQSFPADQGGLIEVNGGARIEFAANSIRLEGGGSYQGEVRVAAQWLDPAARRTLDQMPGNLQGVNTLNEEVALETFGMMAVELQGSNGEALNIAEGATATLRMPIPDDLLAAAPSSIPLWSFHEGHGIWAQESSAGLQNGFYVGDVSHFSFWNCDAPFPVVKVCFRLVDEDGNPLVDHYVRIRRPDGSSRGGYTDANGEICDKFPADEELVLEVYSNNSCGSILFTQNIGPFSMMTDLGDIVVTSPQVTTTSVTGQLVDCDGNPVLDGLLIIDFNENLYGDEIYEYLTDGSFDLNYSDCNNSGMEVKVTAINLDGLITADPITITIGQANDLGNIELCDQPTTYALELTIDGETVIYPDAQLRVFQDTFPGEHIIQISKSTPATNGYFYMTLNGLGVGDYSNDNNVSISEPLLEWLMYGQLSSVTLDTFGDVGEEVGGVFSGTLTNRFDQNMVDVDVSGSFLLIRQQ
ncbi:MAG: hypothetical protein AAGG75_07105 [Bacteroidota bacterium]